MIALLALSIPLAILSSSGRDLPWPVIAMQASEEQGDAAQVVAPATVELERVTLRDADMGDMVSHTLLAPKGWKVSGGQHWRPQAYRDFVRLDLRVAAEDGRELAVYPGGFYEDSDVYELIAQMGGQSNRPRPGQVLGNGLTHMPLPASAADYVTEQLLPRHRPRARKLRVLSKNALPVLEKQMRELNAPLVESMRRNEAQLRQLGAQVQSSFEVVAERVRVAYREGGRECEEDVWVLGTVSTTVEGNPGLPPVTQVHWNMLDPRGVRAPAGRLDAARPLLEAVSLSLQADPRYTAVLMDLQHRINMQQLDALARRGEIARRGRDEAWRIHQKGVREREASNERNQQLVVESLRDVDRFEDLDGSLIELPSVYSDVYSNGEGGYILSNEPTYDPNDGSTVRWERIGPKR